MNLKQNITYTISNDEIQEVIQMLPDDNYYFRRPYDFQQHMIPINSLKRYLLSWLSKKSIKFELVETYKYYQAIRLTNNRKKSRN